jgi:hypothetical protein
MEIQKKSKSIIIAFFILINVLFIRCKILQTKINRFCYDEYELSYSRYKRWWYNDTTLIIDRYLTLQIKKQVIDTYLISKTRMRWVHLYKNERELIFEKDSISPFMKYNLTAFQYNRPKKGFKYHYVEDEGDSVIYVVYPTDTISFKNDKAYRFHVSPLWTQDADFSILFSPKKGEFKRYLEDMFKVEQDIQNYKSSKCFIKKMNM